MSCKIVLENFHGTYYPGSTIKGRVVCTFSARDDIRGIRVKLRGREHTSWTERESYYDSSAKKTKYRTVHYSGDNKFVSVDITLRGEGTMAIGRHEHPFVFHLPENIPNTYTGSYGGVKYYIKANVDIPFAFDYEDQRDFNVEAPIDFNKIASELQLDRVSYQDEKMVCCCCCATGPITLDVHLEKEAFVVGETAKIKVYVTNLSNETIEQLRLELALTVEAKATSPRNSYKHDTELLASYSDTGVGAHGERTYDFEMVIPSSAQVPNFQACSLYKQWSVLNIEAVLPGCHTNLSIDTGVKMGHIPLRGQEFITSAPLQQSQIPGGPFPPPPPTVYVPDSKPPPYQSADIAPPYPGPNLYPPNAGTIGFNPPPPGPADQAKFPSMPMPFPSVAPYPPTTGPSSAPNAPPEESAPSAPSKAAMAEEDDFVLLGDQGPSGGGAEPPPPTYDDALARPNAPYPPK